MQHPDSYSPSLKLFHWVVALIVIAMLCVSFFLGDLPETYQPTAYTIHKSFGLTVLALMMIRLILVIKNGKPRLPETVPTWQKILARLVQYGLYLLLFAMPISGWVMSVAANKIPYYFGLFPVSLPIDASKPLAKLMNQTHVTIVWVLIALIILHIAGAMKHYLIDKDRVLFTIIPKKCSGK